MGANDGQGYAARQVSRRVSIGGVAQPYGVNEVGHQGLYHDEETSGGGGLVYNRARMLHTGAGRFAQRDPLGYVDGPMMYQYVGSSPTNFVDPWGLDYFRYTVTQNLSSDPPKIRVCARVIRVHEQNWLGGWFSDAAYESGVSVNCQDICPDALDETLRRLHRFLSEQTADMTMAWAYNNLADAEAQSAWLLAETGMILAGGGVAKGAQGAMQGGKTAVGFADDAARAVAGSSDDLAKAAAKTSKKPTWPRTAEEMDDMLGMRGQKVPDGPTTPGRDKTAWKPSDHIRLPVSNIRIILMHLNGIVIITGT